MIISYDSATAAEAENGLRATAVSLAATLQDLTSSVTAVCSGWEGDEKVMYQDIQRRWGTAAADAHEVLGRITQALGNNTQAVQTMRSRVQSTLAG